MCTNLIAMSISKDITIRFKKNQADNASDSLTTYSLMAVLAGSVFIQVLAIDTNKLFITSADKLFIVILSGLSLLFLLIAVESTIDIFHFRSNNEAAEIQKKYRRQLNLYNKAVILLITVFIYMFWAYLIRKIADLILANVSQFAYHHHCTALLIKYLVLVVCAGITFFVFTKRWRSDLKFIKNATIVVEDVD